jgi:4-hydroxy-2-oxoheptanedioate aldolase
LNLLERKMVDALKDLRENHYVIGVKAEFEAEGTRLEEAYRLKEVIMKAGLGLTLKIGGCEALRDMYEARVLGVERLVAPMVESPYALGKFLNAVKQAFPPEELDQITLCVNIETIEACNNFDKMMAIPNFEMLNGIVMGRVDLSGSMGLSRDDVNCEPIFKLTKELFTKAKNRVNPLECAVGGGVGKDAIPFFRKLSRELVDRYETRKVIFQCPGAFGENAETGILKAVGFELMWLKNKRDYYGMIFNEDNNRIEMLESRYKTLILEAGGKYE